MPTKKRRKRSALAIQKQRTWEVFSKYIRLRDSDEFGYCTCCTCGTVRYWEKDGMQAGHFLDGRGNSILFEETCVHAQCNICNGTDKYYKTGRDTKTNYTLFMLDKYGRDEVNRLRALKIVPRKYDIEELRELEEIYTDKIIGLTMSKELAGVQ